MQVTELAVCNIGLFGDGVRHFWLNDLSGLLEKFPDLEFPHKQDFYTLIIVEEAEGEIVIDNHKIRLDRAKAIIIKPRCVNSIVVAKSLRASATTQKRLHTIAAQSPSGLRTTIGFTKFAYSKLREAASAI